MKTPHESFDPDDPRFDPWADDPNAPKEPGFLDEEVTPPPRPRGPGALLDPALRGEIEFEILFQQTKQLCLQPAPAVAPRLLLSYRTVAVILCGLICISMLHESLRLVGWLVVATLLHEASHALALRGLGYTEWRRYFLPLYVGMAIGRSPPAAPWHQGLVALAGPLPGLILAGVLYTGTLAPIESTLFPLIIAFLVVNGLHLLPVTPLVGGRLLEVLVLGRQAWVGTILRALAVATLMAGVIYFDGVLTKLCLGTTAIIVLLTAPWSHRQAQARRRIHTLVPHLPPLISQVSDRQLRELFKVSLAVSLQGGDDSLRPSQLALVMQGLHAQATQGAVRGWRAAVLMAGCLIGLLIVGGVVAQMVQVESQRSRATVELAGLLTRALAGDAQQLQAVQSLWGSIEPIVRQRAVRQLRDAITQLDRQDPLRQTFEQRWAELSRSLEVE